MNKQVCENCKWEDDGVCCNGSSYYCADFVSGDMNCEEWEGKDE